MQTRKNCKRPGLKQPDLGIAKVRIFLAMPRLQCKAGSENSETGQAAMPHCNVSVRWKISGRVRFQFRTLVRTGVWRGFLFRPRTLRTAEISRKSEKGTLMFCAKPWYAPNPGSEKIRHLRAKHRSSCGKFWRFGPGNAGQISEKEKAHKHKQIFPVTAQVGRGLPTGWSGVSRPVARGQKLCAVCGTQGK